jgi:iron complex transport system permease protein
LVALGVVTAAIAVLALGVGIGEFSPGDVVALFEGDALVQLRGRRIVLALAVGASLSGVGAALQATLHNPLADPYIIGVSGGAALVGSVAVGLGVTASFAVAGFAVGGALLSCVALVYFARHPLSGRSDVVVLVGVAINAFAAAGITLIKTLLPATDAQRLLFWLVGSLGYLSMGLLVGVVATAFVGLLVLLLDRGRLEVLALGDEEAHRLGVAPGPLRRRVFVASSAVVGVVVAFTGMIGFVGLVVPHLLRLIWGRDLRLVLPASVLAGAGLMVAFDATSRLLFNFWQTEIPVGAITALFGAPVFGLLLLRRHPGGISP